VGADYQGVEDQDRIIAQLQFPLSSRHIKHGHQLQR